MTDHNFAESGNSQAKKRHHRFYFAIPIIVLLTALLLQGTTVSTPGALADNTIPLTEHTIAGHFDSDSSTYTTDVDRDALGVTDHTDDITEWENNGDETQSYAPTQAGGPVARGIQIPVIVNVYPGAVVRAQAIVEANKILRQANMKLVVVKTNWIHANSGGVGQWGGDNGSGGGAAGDGQITHIEGDVPDEGEAVRKFGSNEIAKLPNQKGIKISFCQTPMVGSPTPGVAVHRDPTIIVRDRGNAQDTGETIAHEIGHVMTLGAGHRIAIGTNADDAGHAPNKPGNNGNGNAMAPSNRRVGTHLTQDQIDEMRRRRLVHGKCAAQWKKAYPAIKDEQQYGTITDALGDHGDNLSIYDLDQVYLTSLAGAYDIDVQITVAGLISPSMDIDANYSLGFDTDAYIATGVLYGELAGVDRIVTVIATGNIVSGTFVVTGEVYDPISDTVISLDVPPIVAIEAAYVDLDEPAQDIATSFLFTVPKELLNLSAVEAPVVATSGGTEALYDLTDVFVFDSERWLDDPTLTPTLGTGVPTPGDAYPFQVSGLNPNDEFVLYLDDTPVLTDTLDATGSFSGTFTFPIDLPADEFYFLTAQDSTGEFAYNITSPDDHRIYLPQVLKDS
jgi:hypothetical protein